MPETAAEGGRGFEGSSHYCWVRIYWHYRRGNYDRTGGGCWTGPPPPRRGCQASRSYENTKKLFHFYLGIFIAVQPSNPHHLYVTAKTFTEALAHLISEYAELGPDAIIEVLTEQLLALKQTQTKDED